MKSRLPFCSAAARNGSSSPRGNGKSGNSVGQETDLASQPIDEGTRRSPGEHVRHDRLMFVRVSHGVAMQRWRRGLRTQQKAGPNLRSRGAEGNSEAKIQQVYGHAKDQIKKDVDEWFSALKK